MSYFRSLLTKVIAAGPGRKSRLHDEKGNFIGIRRLALSAPRAVSTGLLRIAFDYRPETPWISYAAISVLDNFLNKSSRVLEYGSGMSTVWYAKRAGEVYAVEDSKPWYEKVILLLQRKQISNVHLHYASGIDEYSQFMARDSTGFDLIIVDGNFRYECTVQSLSLLKKGGIFYLDNSDRGLASMDEDTRMAEELILKFAQERNAETRYFTDFAPTQLFVQQGLMVRLPERTEGRTP